MLHFTFVVGVGASLWKFCPSFGGSTGFVVYVQPAADIALATEADEPPLLPPPSTTASTTAITVTTPTPASPQKTRFRRLVVNVGRDVESRRFGAWTGRGGGGVRGDFLAKARARVPPRAKNSLNTTGMSLGADFSCLTLARLRP